eukprot:CAMPEP_0196767934 /NCGR_PEP_ID=MMETSP1095-20130614/42143_1 /TAXON_ID=96789 ORGANISM="Chromulina nebulosa, Strain UTEXLB2642" /NCGR_SAMPLE_ID=MMETSP1095 /ASSEMBLY_ACC=CAM_ASM_000446 /LENGTH=274 /DNA_ID=CAMNT_0042136805 /DNA_START=1656 /DNA_END=2477 /DNA_ORIENTATION=+
MARVSDTIPVLYVPGSTDIGEHPTKESIDNYNRYFGADYFGFWFGGVRCLILNSCLLRHPEDLPDHTKLQDEWFDEEIEIAKLSSTHLLIFTNHPWFINHAEEDDTIESLQFVIPKEIRLKWLKKLRHSKVKYLYSGNYRKNNKSNAFVKINSSNNDIDTVDSNDVDIDIDYSKLDYKPSEIITKGLESGELNESDVINQDKDSDSDNDDSHNDDDNNKEKKDDTNDSDEEGFTNEDADYLGPTQIICTSISAPRDNDNTGLYIVKVQEENIQN